MTMGKIVGFGDILVRFSPWGYDRFVQSDSFRVNYTGAEANTLAFLAWNGMDTDYVTRIPDNMIGDCAVAYLRKFNIGTSSIVRGGDRIGTYYLEKGASQRPSRLVYDRMHSGICEAKRSDFDWEKIFRNASWFHFTGITPALGGELPDICLDACRTAREMGITVSCDLNYRKNLWTVEKAQETMSELVKYVDILTGNEEDSEKVLGVKPSGTDVTRGKLDRDAYVEAAGELSSRFGFKKVLFTLRESISANDNNWSGMLYQDGQSWFSRTYPIHIVDRVGGGDSFSAGVIYAGEMGWSNERTIEFAVAASCLKHSIEQDFNLSYVSEVESLAGGDGSGRIVR